MEHELTELPSGIRIVSEHLPTVRSVAIGFWVAVGSRDERPEEHGCSHFLEHTLFKGTGRRSARQIAEELDAVGGELNAFTSKELTCFYARVLDDDVPLAVDVLADMLRDARNTAEDVDAERQVVLSEIDIHLDSPEDLAHSDFAELLLAGHPLSLETLGTVDSIRDMTRDRIHDYYLRHYRPETLVVAAAGNVDHDRLVALVAEHVGDLGRPGGAPPARTAPDGFGLGEVTIRPRPTEQAHLVLGGVGLPGQHDRRHQLRVLSTLLGGGMSSRLFQEIRETRGLAYTTYSYLSGFSDTGYYGAYVGTSPGRADEALKVMRDELDGLADTVTAGEVERAKGALLGGTVLGLEDTGSRMMRLGKLVAMGAEIRSLDEMLGSIEAVDLDQVRAIARDVVAAPRALAVVGPFTEADTDRFRPALR